MSNALIAVARVKASDKQDELIELFAKAHQVHTEQKSEDV
jgi:hypothetical protein